MSKYKRALNIKWFATTRIGIEELAKNTNFELTSSDFRLLFYLLSKIDEDNRATIPKQKDISAEINISIRKISEGLRRLREAKIIVKTDESKSYFINPAFFYTGGALFLDAKQEDFDSNFNPSPQSYTPTADNAEIRRNLEKI
ncbi:hypothetical protein GGG87_09460 [Streptococcus sp. zg-86]|uniref:Plasmid replication protein RepL domain-containing protein n=1 Tax=Streptococcus zhangguiae TaxID=2664091 RepID=A0ABW9R6V0_9STRE|nr:MULTISPECIES: helix-turn-helix domain-containing protein [unclassified Streptococcus]MTB65221.1 hypothetical protein [Streptococcus sp. zg-86]MTB91548.1 hypothetical protein [Streptococcus sp. zg-36]